MKDYCAEVHTDYGIVFKFQFSAQMRDDETTNEFNERLTRGVQEIHSLGRHAFVFIEEIPEIQLERV